ncbi:replication initiator protein RepSA [Streptomyces sp. NPDC017056]|uniref:replication initiator protein RepSA n=1 Tax=Streptomyces sp. NPDC017056 TaxID=3364973 RepID=UPI0037A0516D
MTATAPAADLPPATLLDVLRVATAPDFDRWQEQIRKTGGCARPVHLTGWTFTRDTTTGRTLHRYSTRDEPGGRLRIACGNRRASRCPACAWIYAGDTYHLIRAGLAGDETRNIPTEVRDHPRVFATFTAPSFGPVHNRIENDGQLKRGHNGQCRCGVRHSENDPILGTPLDPRTYDYAAAVLFNNHAGELWQRFTNRLRRELAARAGLTQRELSQELRLSYGKVAEFQKRGAVHFHAVIRLDGPDGPDTPPPAWATTALLTDAIRAAAAHSYTTITVPPNEEAGYPRGRTLRWGTQLDIRPVRAFGDGTAVTEQAVASYVAKYATKAAETGGGLDRTMEELAELDRHPELTDHARRLIRTCWDLDAAYPDRRLRAWAHMLGFRGHFSTKSRHYSTTLGALRQTRADYRAAEQRAALGLPEPDSDTTLVFAHWRYAGVGHSLGEFVFAATIAEDLRINREIAREAMLELHALGGDST